MTQTDLDSKSADGDERRTFWTGSLTQVKDWWRGRRTAYQRVNKSLFVWCAVIFAATGFFLVIAWQLWGSPSFGNLGPYPTGRATASLTTVGGLGGAVFLTVKYRAHSLAERQERWQAAEESRARESHQTMLVVQQRQAVVEATRLLDSDVASTRIAGVTILAEIADTYLDSRQQQVVDILCGYLRTEHNSEEKGHDPAVESAILNTFASHLRESGSPETDQLVAPGRLIEDAELWCDCRFDLHGATFAEPVNLNGVTFGREVDFSSAVFKRTVGFRGASFLNGASISKARFMSPTTFERAVFGGPINFSNVFFDDYAVFVGARFDMGVDFQSVSFTKYAEFSRSMFRSGVDFQETHFTNTANFSKSRFSDFSNFAAVTFGRTARFDEASFEGPLSFNSAQFEGQAKFEKTSFYRPALFQGVVFDDKALFSRAFFASNADFGMTTFRELAMFTNAVFGGSTQFVAAVFDGTANFKDAEFIQDGDYSKAEFRSDVILPTGAGTGSLSFEGTKFNRGGYPMWSVVDGQEVDLPAGAVWWDFERNE